MARRGLGLSPRNELSRALSKDGLTMRAADIEDADRWVDEALTALETEEPSMLKWVSEDPFAREALNATTIAIFNSVNRAMHQGRPMGEVLRWISFYNYRLAAASAWHSANRERGNP